MKKYEASQRLDPDFDYVSIIQSIRKNRSSAPYHQTIQKNIIFPREKMLCTLCREMVPFFEFPTIKSTKCFHCDRIRRPKNLIDKKLQIVETYKNSQLLGSDFDYDSIIRRLHEEKAQKPAVVSIPATRVIDNYKCEVPIEKVREYLDQCHKKHVRAKFYYKNQSFPREVDIQMLNESYLKGQTSGGRRTFRIDRITKI